MEGHAVEIVRADGSVVQPGETIFAGERYGFRIPEQPDLRAELDTAVDLLRGARTFVNEVGESEDDFYEFRRAIDDFLARHNFGAKQDGITDDTTAVQAAFDAGYQRRHR